MSHISRYSNARGAAQSDGVSFMDRLSGAVRDNPLPAALIGMGVLWLFAGGSKMSLAGGHGRKSVFGAVEGGAGHVGSSVKYVANQAGAAISTLAHGTADTVSGAAGRIGDLVSTVSGQVADAASSAYDAAGETVSSGMRALSGASQNGYSTVNAPARAASALQQNLADLFDRQPLLLGAAGFALGAGIAASLPVSQAEKQAMGTASAFVHDKVSETATQVKDLANAALDEARARA